MNTTQNAKNVRKENTIPAKDKRNSKLKALPDVLLASEVSAVLGVSEKTIYTLLKEGVLKSLKVGREYRIPKLYLMQYLGVKANSKIESA